MSLALQQAGYETAITQLWAGQADAAHDMGHLRRVWANAQAIAASEPGADLEVLLAAAYFHDAVNLPKNAPNRAAASQLSADWAREYLSGTDFPAKKLDAVAHTIAAHSFSAGITPETLEAQILQDADRLEALGAIGMARMFAVTGQMGGALFDAEDPLATARPLDDKAFALDHLEVKLFPVAAAMQTETGRRMAAERADFMRGFRDQLLTEIG
ncbi:HD domain-containing protein [Xinfangfangia sp. CPCC 101601]|uniref:HD domain-containing protein n=1 Tax=Pseudogemmobacter lacusdianii TaxID=3069608 RepID=A0ABU0VVJ8_9RHOB|nr:HD domain-containing protein [Xinfangfangia sp. CPCC 101601]MDQ2065766.1 HD domain-containing protein [Xinfangfangia sp. CPCC 101601]